MTLCSIMGLYERDATIVNNIFSCECLPPFDGLLHFYTTGKIPQLCIMITVFQLSCTLPPPLFIKKGTRNGYFLFISFFVLLFFVAHSYTMVCDVHWVEAMVYLVLWVHRVMNVRHGLGHSGHADLVESDFCVCVVFLSCWSWRRGVLDLPLIFYVRCLWPNGHNNNYLLFFHSGLSLKLNRLK